MSDSPGWTSPGSPRPEDGAGPDGTADGRPRLDKPGPSGGSSGGTGQPQGWQAAPPPGPAGAPGSSGPSGWSGGGGWSGPPAGSVAPRPGVIPLRPLGVGEILDGAVSTARAHWRTVLSITLGIAILVELFSILAMRTWLGDSSGFAALENNPQPTESEVRDAMGDLFGFSSVVGIFTLLATVLATALLTIVVARAVLGRSVTLGEAWQDARHRLLRLLGLVLLVVLITVGALVVPMLLAATTGSLALTVLAFFGGLVLAVWLGVRLSLATPALMLEREGIRDAMRRSWKLVGGSWWRVFGIQLLVAVLLLVVAGVIEFPASIIAGLVSGEGAGNVFDGSVTELSWTYLAVSGIGSVLASTVTLPISAGTTALLYIDQRIRREALDLELARAAGVDDEPGAGS